MQQKSGYGWLLKVIFCPLEGQKREEMTTSLLQAGVSNQP